MHGFSASPSEGLAPDRARPRAFPPLRGRTADPGPPRGLGRGRGSATRLRARGPDALRRATPHPSPGPCVTPTLAPRPAPQSRPPTPTPAWLAGRPARRARSRLRRELTCPAPARSLTPRLCLRAALLGSRLTCFQPGLRSGPGGAAAATAAG